MRVTRRQLRRIIREEADIILNYENADELEAREDAWSGGENLSLPLDHSKAVKGPAVTDAPEMLAPAPPVLNNENRRIRVYRGEHDLGRSCVLPPIVYERYYNAYAAGNTEKALGILEEHLDKRIPGWLDYEW